MTESSWQYSQEHDQLDIKLKMKNDSTMAENFVKYTRYNTGTIGKGKREAAYWGGRGGGVGTKIARNLLAQA